MNTKTKLQNLLEVLQKGLLEREEAIRLALLSAIAGESIFFLGPPGVAKSLIARRLKFAFLDAKSFEYLMNRFSSPEEIFGPVSITELQNDNYMRITEGYLPEAEIVFLDEIWKAGPSIQNTLLTVLNEKIFRNGRETQKVPLKALIAASNELPAENEGLEALWDRFLIRYVISPIQSTANFNQMLRETEDLNQDSIPKELKITHEEYETWSQEIPLISISQEVLQVIELIRKKVAVYNQNLPEEQKPLYISDRRWKKIARILRTSALLNGRKEVDLIDCYLIQHCIWNEESEMEKAKEIVLEAIQKSSYVFADPEWIRENINKLKDEIDREYLSKNWMEPVEYHVNIELKVYYKILGMERLGYPSQCYIARQYFSQLNKTNFTVVYLSPDRPGRPVMELEVFEMRLIDDYKMVCKYNPNVTLSIELRKKPELPVIKEKLKKEIQKEVQSSQQKIQEQISGLEAQKKERLTQFQSNLFASSTASKLIETEVEKSIQKLKDLKLELEKIPELIK